MKRYGMRAYVVDGPRGKYVIRRMGSRFWHLRSHSCDVVMPWGLYGMRFPRLREARQFAEREVGLGKETIQ